MKAIRLTPKQSRHLVTIHSKWGQYFHALAFIPGKCVREPTAGELAAHFQAIASDLQATHVQLLCAVTLCDYAEAQRLAEHALYLESSLTDENRACGLVCLTDEARELAVRLLARAAAKDGERCR